MTEWKARKAAKEQPLREPAPTAISERLGELGADIWSMALELANGRLSSEREALETARVQLEAEKAEAAEMADQVTAELEETKAHLARVKVSEGTARSEAEALRQQLAAAQLQAATAETRAEEIAKRVADLNTELGRVNQQNTDLVAAFSAAAKPTPDKKLKD